MIYKEEHELNLELMPHFSEFTRGINSGSPRARLEAFDRWHMTFKGVCYRRQMMHLYDESDWNRLREIHTVGANS